MNQPKILIAGVGGVGGCIACQMIRRYGENVTLLARGRRKKYFESKGLTMHGDYYGDYTVMPAKVVESAKGLEAQDLIIVSVKNFSLEEMIEKIRPAVGPETIVMTVMNGVSAGKRLQEAMTQARVLQSVIYTVSMSLPDYTIRQIGNFTWLHTGPVKGPGFMEEAKRAEKIFNDAEIECHATDRIESECWSKYVLNSAYNVVTARWGITIGDIKKNPKLCEDYQKLLTETYNTAIAKGVSLPEDLVETFMIRLRRTDDTSTSSLSRDYDLHIKGETDLFSKDIIDMAREVGVETPLLEEYYQGMQKRMSQW